MYRPTIYMKNENNKNWLIFSHWYLLYLYLFIYLFIYINFFYKFAHLLNVKEHF